jgi:hypothetical protein
MALVAGNGQSYAVIHQYVVSYRLEKSPLERKAFRDIEKALSWLDITDAYEIKYPDLDKMA